MAFIVEDGTGVLNANSYATVQGFKDYFGDRGTDVSAITDPTIQTLLVQATDYIETRWGLLFLGRKEFLTLCARAIFTMTDNPTDGETVTVGTETFTFRVAPSVADEVQIGADSVETAVNLAGVMGTGDGIESAEAFPDEAKVVAYTTNNGVAVSDTALNGSWDQPLTFGKSVKEQPLQFPRINLFDRAGQPITGIPDNLKEATYEYALRANTSALAPDPETSASGAQVTKLREKVGPIEEETEFSDQVSVKITKPYPAADRRLKEYVRSGGQVIRA